jgi:hypothetical protein
MKYKIPITFVLEFDTEPSKKELKSITEAFIPNMAYITRDLDFMYDVVQERTESCLNSISVEKPS